MNSSQDEDHQNENSHNKSTANEQTSEALGNNDEASKTQQSLENLSLKDGNQEENKAVEENDDKKGGLMGPHNLSSDKLREKVISTSDEQESEESSKEQGGRSEEMDIEKSPSLNKNTEKNSSNLLFYQNKIKSRPKGVFLKEMHEKWWGDYERLEDDHSYIQWLFPNFYQSAFNSDAQKLYEHEAEIFRSDPEIAKNLVKSYELILDFYGMKLTDYSTGAIERNNNFPKRYKDALLTYLHNHLRMRRILTHLNNVGFRRYAVSLVDFLEKEIYGELGAFEKFCEESSKFNKKAFAEAPLRKIARMRGAFEVWEMYGDHKDDPERIKLLEKNCFSKYPEGFKESIYFENL